MASPDREVLLIEDEEDEDEGLGFGEVDPATKLQLRHRLIAFTHVIFRASALLIYFFGGIFDLGFLTSSLLIISLSAIDFYVVKNITGRVLVGLRWGKKQDASGKSEWVFEGKKGAGAGGRIPERKIFWTTLIATPALWALFAFASFITFRFLWMILTLVALSFTGVNLYGYVRCKIGHQPGLSDATGLLGQRLSSLLLNQAFSSPATQSKDGAKDVENSFVQQV